MTERQERAPQDTRAAVEKACVLLTAFGDAGGNALGVSELARRAGLTKSTAHRHLGILERAAMVERSGRGYRIGQGLRSLVRGATEVEHSCLADALLPYLVELFEVARHTVQLAVLDGTDAVYIGKVYGHHSVTVPSRQGERLPAHCTAGGKLLMAYRPSTARLPRQPLRRLTARTVQNHLELDRELVEIRKRGIAFDRGGASSEVACIAAPVVGMDGQPLAAVSLCAPSDANLVAFADVIRHIASAASRRVTHAMTMKSARSPQIPRSANQMRGGLERVLDTADGHCART